jgi:hypothetical protein
MKFGEGGAFAAAAAGALGGRSGVLLVWTENLLHFRLGTEGGQRRRVSPPLRGSHRRLLDVQKELVEIRIVDFDVVLRK